MAIRDMDIAAELIGFRPFHTKLLAFSVSSFYVGIAGALALALWLGSVETAEAFDINQSFQILFMIIIGGLGSMLGSFIGAAFIVLMPIVLTNVMVYGFGFAAVTAKHFEFIFFGWADYFLFNCGASWYSAALADSKREVKTVAVPTLRQNGVTDGWR